MGNKIVNIIKTIYQKIKFWYNTLGAPGSPIEFKCLAALNLIVIGKDNTIFILFYLLMPQGF